MPQLEIACTACGMEVLLVREPVYEGFVKTGETLSCANCGHLFESEEDVPFKSQNEPSIFGEDEMHILCRYCVHYVVNPFTQWCGLHKREVEATDTCEQFEPKEENQG